MKWKEEMKVRSTNVESAPPRKKKFATLAHQLVSLSMKFSAQKREKKTKTSFFKLLFVLQSNITQCVQNLGVTGAGNWSCQRHTM